MGINRTEAVRVPINIKATDAKETEVNNKTRRLGNMFTDDDVVKVRDFFAVFRDVRCFGTLPGFPTINLDPDNTSPDESYIVIDGGLSIGKTPCTVPSITGPRPGIRYTVHNEHGEEEYSSRNFGDAIKFAMKMYAGELYRRISDRHTSEVLAGVDRILDD